MLREMKKRKKKGIWQLVVCFLLCACLSVSVYADEGGMQKPDYATDYYMIIESPDGGINIYPRADLSQQPLNSELIPNGTALRILGELTDDNNRVWGYTAYLGMNGYVPLDDCTMATEQEAIDSELALAGDDHRNYNADYDVEVSSEDNTVVLRRGPGKKYNRVSGSGDVPGGTVLHMDEDVEMKDGSHWGHTGFGGLSGWVNLDELKNWDGASATGSQGNVESPVEGSSVGAEAPVGSSQDSSGAPSKDSLNNTEVPGDNSLDNAEVPGEDSTDNTEAEDLTSSPAMVSAGSSSPTPSPAATSTPVPTATPAPEPTATPTPEPTTTPTPEPTETPTPEPTQTPTPEPTETPTPEPTVTPETEPTATPEAEPSATPEAENSEESEVTGGATSGQGTSGQEAETAKSPIQNPVVWICGLAILIILLLLIYRFVKRNKD